MRRELHLPVVGDPGHQRHRLCVRRRGDGGREQAGGEELAKHDPGRGYPSVGFDRVTRLLALAALALAWHGSTATAAPEAHVPILEFHVIGDPAPGAPNAGLYDSESMFRAQLAWLALH